jgi:uncharacterized protein with HEPN domain
VPPREWFMRLEDLLESIERVEASLKGMSYDEFERNPDKTDAAIRNLTVIGEAANHLPEEIKQKFPNVPWAKIVAMRNFVVHEYFGITLKVIWDTAKALPNLKEDVSNIVSRGRAEFSTTVVTQREPKTKRRSGLKKKK